ncbi:MAG TPA: hypothetical protein VHE58_03105 [Burkholderiales bacterium]|nr:hypothetical protein [Burkholderiales bacterium]
MRFKLALISAIFLLVFVAAGCATMSDVVTAKADGTSETYPVNADQAWEISKTVFRWEGADAIEEHRDQGYMVTSSGITGYSYGAVMGAWVDKIDANHTKVTVVTKRRVKLDAFTTMMESTYHKRFAQAVAIVKRGEPLPLKAPSE